MAGLLALTGLGAGAAEAGISFGLGDVLGLAGSAVSAAGTIAAGKAQSQAAEFEAQQREIQAAEERAAAQREAEQQRRRKELALSQLQSRAAASGFTATDPTTLALADDIAQYGTLQEQMSQYGGESRAQGRLNQAAAARYEGAAARQEARFKAASTIIGGFGSLAARYSPRRSTLSSYYG